MKSAFKKMRGRSIVGHQSFRQGPVKPTREEVSPDHLIGLKDSKETAPTDFSMRASMDARKRSGSFGSRMLRRAKSAVGRQTRKVNEEGEKMENGTTFSEKLQKASPRLRRALFKKQISLNESYLHQTSRRISPPNEYSVMKPNAIDGSFYEDNSVDFRRTSEVNTFPTIMMQGDLYRRKRLTWSKTWAVLAADRVLTLFKTKEDFESSRKEWNRLRHPVLGSPTSVEKTLTMGDYGNTTAAFTPAGIFSVINLSGGCEIENVVQGKKSTTFQLIPHSYQAMTQGVALTLPFEPGSAALNKSVHLMCKNNDEFLYWVKAFVQLNTNDGPVRSEASITPPRRHLGLDAETRREKPLLHHHKHSLGQGKQLGVRDQHLYSVDNTGIEMEDSRAPVSQAQGAGRQSAAESQSESHSTASPLDQLKFIDEDDDADYVGSGVRVLSGLKDNVATKQYMSPRTIFKITEKGKEQLRNEDLSTREGRVGRPVNPPDTHKVSSHGRKNAEDTSKGHTEHDDEAETEFKKCSTTEKVDMRRAQIVAGAGKSTPAGTNRDREPTVKVEKNKHRRKDRNGNKRIEDKKVLLAGEIFIKTAEGKTHDTVHIGSGHRRRQEPSEIISSKTNKPSRTREKQAREKGARKRAAIADASDCDTQTIQSLQPDKRSGVSSSDAPVYSSDKVANENIRSGLGSVKDKHSELANSPSIIQCDPTKIGENLRDLEAGESKGGESKDEPNKRDESTDSASVGPQSSTEAITDPSVKYPALYNTHNSIRRIKSRSKAFTNIRKQKSLRQKVFLKLGSRASLSNSSPDIPSTTKAEDIGPLEIPAIEISSPSVNLRRNSAFRRDSSPLVGTRSLSEGDLLEAVAEEVDGHNMRTFKNVRKISQDNFIETYGVIPRKKNGKRMDHTKRHTTYENSTKDDLAGFTLYADEFQDTISSTRRSSTSENSSSSDSSYQASLTNSDPQVREVLESTRKASLDKCPSHGDINSIISRHPKSTCSDDSSRNSSTKDEPRNSWLASLTPHFARKASKPSAPTAASKNAQGSRRAVFHIPASQLTSAAHRGYLDRRNKKKQWERFWCVLQDSCLYCYNSPQSEYTVDAVVLRGYDVIADVTNMNRSRFPLRLERNGSPTYHFSSENHQQFLLWVGTLEKETSNVLPATSDNEVLVNSVKTTANANRPDNAASHETGVRPESVDNAQDHETYETQKENLLREVLAQQQKLIEERKRLHQQNSNAALTTMPDYTSKRLSKDLVNEKYSRAKDEEEMKIMKSLTHLNRRRNSAQLKVDNFTKQLAPKSGRKRRENPQQFAEMEEKLRQLQERLAIVDKEIQDKHAMRQDTIEKIQQRRDLELVLLEQQENLAIIRKHQARQKRAAFAEQTQPQTSNDRLASIDEMSSISDCSSTSSNSLPDPLTMGIDARLQASTPRQNRAGVNANGAISDESCFHRSSDMDEVMSQSNSSIEGGLSDDFRSMSTSSEEDRLPRRTISSNSAVSMASVSSIEDHAFRKADEVNPSILAEIEDFQRFSKQKLAKLGSNE